MPLDGHDQGADAQLGPEVVGHGPADDLARGHVLDRGQIQEALVGRDVGDVGQPDPGLRRGRLWSGLSAVKFRASRFGATGRSWRLSVVRGVRRRPRRAESPISRISRATRRRECRSPSRRSSAWTRGEP